MFIVLLKYTQPLEVIDSLMGEHVRFLRRHIKEKVFIVAGRQVPRRGGVIFARGQDRDEIEAIMRQDPFCLANAAEFEVIQFRSSLYHGDFKPWIDS